MGLEDEISFWGWSLFLGDIRSFSRAAAFGFRFFESYGPSWMIYEPGKFITINGDPPLKEFLRSPILAIFLMPTKIHLAKL